MRAKGVDGEGSVPKSAFLGSQGSNTLALTHTHTQITRKEDFRDKR